MQSWEQNLSRWQAAGVVDEATAGRIRTFEAADARPAGHRWQVLIALTLGGILLGAGVLLFVAAHWDEVSPLERLSLVVGALALLHIGAISAAGRFDGLATALHAVGTVGAGGAIAMVGQIFNMQEHWPAAILLWALCAAAGWWLLRDQFQQVLALLLAPAWLICEWTYRANTYGGGNVYCARMIAVLAAVYLTAFVHSRQRVVAGILFGVSAAALIVTTVILAEDAWRSYYGQSALPLSLRVSAIVIMLMMMSLGWLADKRSALPVLAVATMSFALPWLQANIHGEAGPGGRAYTYDMPSVTLYGVVAAVALLFCWHGVQERSRALVNYGIACFALTVAWFYFSSLMDKLGRSLGLIGLGILFLAGGWLLERTRRRLITHMNAEATA
jgi:uncharacterized membrane protein